MVSEESIARDLMAYLKANRDVCARGNANGWLWIRFVDGEWRAVRYGGEHRLREYIDGTVFDEERALRWLESKPVELIPATEAYLWSPKEKTVWEEAAEQSVFTAADRCFWCGQSERTTDLDAYETTEQGECLFCPDCHDSWYRAGEIIGPSGVVP